MLDIRTRLDAGNSLMDALAAHPEVFNKHYLLVMKQAQNSGSRQVARRILMQLQ